MPEPATCLLVAAQVLLVVKPACIVREYVNKGGLEHHRDDVLSDFRSPVDIFITFLNGYTGIAHIDKRILDFDFVVQTLKWMQW